MPPLSQNEKISIPPKADEAEITLFGPGYGESIILKIPNLGWFVVDSCTSSAYNIHNIPPLEYLKAQNVKSLAAVILTHPHKDHYLGLTEIIREYLGSIKYICRYGAEGIREYTKYYVQQHIAKPQNNRELFKLFEIFQEAKENGAWIKRLVESTTIIDDPSNKIKIIALTPSNESVEKYIEELSKFIANKGETVDTAPDRLHNLIASAIWISVGSVRIILGSDVERGTNSKTGWDGVLSHPDPPDLSASSVKVSHHGSPGAFHEKVWKEHNLPISILTPYNKKIPTNADLNRLSKVSSKVGITTKVYYTDPRNTYSRKISRGGSENFNNWHIIKPHKRVGLIRLRFSIDGTIRETLNIPPAYWYSADKDQVRQKHSII